MLLPREIKEKAKIAQKAKRKDSCKESKLNSFLLDNLIGTTTERFKSPMERDRIENEKGTRGETSSRRSRGRSRDTEGRFAGRVRALIRELPRSNLASNVFSFSAGPSDPRGNCRYSPDEIPGELINPEINGRFPKFRAPERRRGGRNDRWETSICNNATDDKTAIV